MKSIETTPLQPMFKALNVICDEMTVVPYIWPDLVRFPDPPYGFKSVGEPD